MSPSVQTLFSLAAMLLTIALLSTLTGAATGFGVAVCSLPRLPRWWPSTLHSPTTSTPLAVSVQPWYKNTPLSLFRKYNPGTKTTWYQDGDNPTDDVVAKYKASAGDGDPTDDVGAKQKALTLTGTKGVRKAEGPAAEQAEAKAAEAAEQAEEAEEAAAIAELLQEREAANKELLALKVESALASGLKVSAKEDVSG